MSKFLAFLCCMNVQTKVFVILNAKVLKSEIMIEQFSKNTWKSGEMRPPFGRGLHFQIMTTGLEELYDSCKINNVKIFRELEDAWYRADDIYVGQRQFVVCDPDGYMLCCALPKN